MYNDLSFSVLLFDVILFLGLKNVIWREKTRKKCLNLLWPIVVWKKGLNASTIIQYACFGRVSDAILIYSSPYAPGDFKVHMSFFFKYFKNCCAGLNSDFFSFLFSPCCLIWALIPKIINCNVTYFNVNLSMSTSNTF